MYVSFRSSCYVAYLSKGTTDAMGYIFHGKDGREIYLIDTPGFDDTDIDNANVFRKISTFLCTVCDGQCVVLGGMIYVQRITDMRMSGSSLNSLRIFEKICGEYCFGNVVVVTTMWSLLKNKEAKDAAIARETMMKERPEIFGKLMKANAKMVRHDEDDHDSPLRVIELLRSANRQRDVNLLLQNEMKHRETMTLGETTAGRFLEGELANTRKKVEQQKREWEELEPEAGEDREEIAEQVKDHARRINQIEIDQGSLSITLDDMKREQKEWWIRKDDEDSQEAIREGKSVVVLQLEDQVQRWRREAREQRQEKHAQKEEMSKKLEAVEKELADQMKREQADQVKREQAVRDKAERARLGGDFLGLMKQALGFANKEPKEPAQPMLRANSMPMDAKQTKRSSSKTTKKGTRPKPRLHKNKSGAKHAPSPDEYAEQQYASHQNHQNSHSYGLDQGYDQLDESESDEESEPEDPAPTTYTQSPPYYTQTVVPAYSNENYVYVPPAHVVTDPNRLIRNPPPPAQPLSRNYANENPHNRQFLT